MPYCILPIMIGFFLHFTRKQNEIFQFDYYFKIQAKLSQLLQLPVPAIVFSQNQWYK